MKKYKYKIIGYAPRFDVKVEVQNKREAIKAYNNQKRRIKEDVNITKETGWVELLVVAQREEIKFKA